MTTLPAATTIQVSTVPLAAYLARMAAIQAAAGTASPLPEVKFALGTLLVGDGNSGGGPAIPSISTLQSTGALVHQIWSGQTIQSVVVDPSNPNQIDISAVIPAVDSSGAEIGPFWVSEFIITDENGTPMIAATTLAPKLITSNGAAYDLNLQAAVAFSAGTVDLTAPSGAYLTEAGAANAISGLLVANAPLSVASSVQSNGWTKWVLSIAGATLAALGVGRPATNAEFAAGAPALGSNTPYPWPTLQQIAGALSSFWADLAGYLPLVGGTLTGFLTLSGNPTANLHAAPKQYVDSGDAIAVSTAEGYAITLLNGFITGWQGSNTGFFQINNGPLAGLKLQWCRNLTVMANAGGDGSPTFYFPVAFTQGVWGYSYCGDDEITSRGGGGCTAQVPSLTSQTINIHSITNSAVLVAVSGFVIGK